MHGMYECGTKVMLSFSGRSHAPVNIADSMEEVNVGGGKMEEMQHLLCCTALYFVHQVFTSSWSSSGLTSPVWIEKQLNYWHFPYIKACDLSAKPHFDIVLKHWIFKWFLDMGHKFPANSAKNIQALHMFLSRICQPLECFKPLQEFCTFIKTSSWLAWPFW